MEYTDKEIQTFVEDQLLHHGEWLTRRFREALEKNKNRESGQLIASMGRNFSVRSSEGGATLVIDILEYGRLMEIGGRKQKIVARNRNIWEKQNHRSKKKTQWYNKNRYAGYGHLVRVLSVGMTDLELQRIRGILLDTKAKFAEN